MDYDTGRGGYGKLVAEGLMHHPSGEEEAVQPLVAAPEERGRKRGRDEDANPRFARAEGQ